MSSQLQEMVVRMDAEQTWLEARLTPWALGKCRLRFAGRVRSLGNDEFLKFWCRIHVNHLYPVDMVHELITTKSKEVCCNCLQELIIYKPTGNWTHAPTKTQPYAHHYCEKIHVGMGTLDPYAKPKGTSRMDPGRKKFEERDIHEVAVGDVLVTGAGVKWTVLEVVTDRGLLCIRKWLSGTESTMFSFEKFPTVRCQVERGATH